MSDENKVASELAKLEEIIRENVKEFQEKMEEIDNKANEYEASFHPAEDKEVGRFPASIVIVCVAIVIVGN